MRYIVKIVLKFTLTLVGVTFLTFLLLHFSPTDPAEMYFHSMGVSYTDEMLEKYKKEKGLDQPFYIQYGQWVSKTIKGDLGQSYDNNEPVADQLKRSLPYTVSLAINSLAISLIIAIPTGFYMALYPKATGSKVFLGLSFLGNSLPNFILGLGLIYFFALKLGWFPVLATNSVRGVVLPSLTLGLVMASKFSRQIATMTSKELDQDHIKGLRARGVSRKRIMTHTVLKNISVNLVTLVGMSMGSLLGGAAVIESLFNWPGLGKLVVDAVIIRDYPMVLGGILWIALSYIIINTLTDLSYVFLDPRIRLGGGSNG